MRADHAPAVLAFELAKRSYFAFFICDRGDEYFRTFTEQHSTQRDQQEVGMGIFHVLVDDDGTILGRFNLYEIHDGTANVGYRVAKNSAGHGVASATLRELCQLAATKYGLRRLSAAVSHENIASQKVLVNTGFIPDGPAKSGGRAGTWFRRILSDS